VIMAQFNILEGEFTRTDRAIFIVLWLVIGFILLWFNTNSPSTYTQVYVPAYLLTSFIIIMGVIAQQVGVLKDISTAIFGFGDLNEKVVGNFDRGTVALAVGTIFGLILTAKLLIGTQFAIAPIAAPKLAITDATQNLFMTSFMVGIMEEMLSVGAIMPSTANAIYQIGISPFLVLAAPVSFFFYTAYSLLAPIFLLLMAFMLRNVQIRQAGLIIGLAIFIDSGVFSILHQSAYSGQYPDPTQALFTAFVFRAIADIINISMQSIVPSITAHIINNSIVQSATLASQGIHLGFITVVPYVMWVIFVYAYKNTKVMPK